MTDVFLSYKREDAERVRSLVDALIAANLTVWWDRDLHGGQAWRGEIARELEEAGCVIVVWSEASVGEGASFVWDEAGRGLSRRVLLPVRIEEVTPPIGFGECQALDLVGWRGHPRDAHVKDVVATAQAIIRKLAWPRPEWPRVRRWRLGLSGSATAALLSLALVPSLQRRICDVSVMQRPCLWIGIERTCTRTQENVRHYVYAARANAEGAPSEAEAKA